MSATDPVITLAGFLKLEAPDGDVRLCDGGLLDYSSERYESIHATFGTVAAFDAIEDGFGDMAEGGGFALAPDPDAALSDWFRADLANCRVRFWLGEVDGNGVTVTTAEMLSDLLVDTVRVKSGAGGQQLLELGTMSRAEKLFLRNEGNVCSQRFHQTVWSGEKGFNNCTDLQGFVAWGAESPPRGTSGGTVGGFSRPGSPS